VVLDTYSATFLYQHIIKILFYEILILYRSSKIILRNDNIMTKNLQFLRDITKLFTTKAQTDTL